ncbi:unnamed protein product, partial [Discosporangium mesarthrocarpum]
MLVGVSVDPTRLSQREGGLCPFRGGPLLTKGAPPVRLIGALSGAGGRLRPPRHERETTEAGARGTKPAVPLTAVFLRIERSGAVGPQGSLRSSSTAFIRISDQARGP